MTTTAIYTAGDGTVLNLNDGVDTQLIDVEGSGIPEPEHFTTPLPLADGDRYLGSRLPSRTLTLFLLLKANSYAARLQIERRLSHALSPRRGVGTLAFSRSDGVVRTISAVYKSGLDFGPSGTIGPLARRMTIAFVCYDPYFYAPQPTVIDFAAYAATTTPKLGSAYGTIYEGSAPTYPIITLSGPMTNPYVQSTNASGIVRSVALNYSLASGSTVELDFRVGKKSVRLNPSGATVDLRPYVTRLNGANPQFWEIAPGRTTFLIAESSNGTGTAKMQFTESFESH